MTFRALVFAAALLLTGCSKITEENFARIQDGMSEQEVAAILGSPTESSSTTLVNLTGTASRWADKETVIVVRFVNGKMVLKSFDKKQARK